ncbi:MAG: hypothetical protein JRF55_17960 [Deltaproteobacteria bacterium]|nr:hypothetical protein [Deltaproteobacteria bacterium]
MGKKKREPAKEAPTSECFHSAFSGLASLRDELPSSGLPDPGPEPNSESTPGTSTASAKLVLQREKKGRAGKTATKSWGAARRSRGMT